VLSRQHRARLGSAYQGFHQCTRSDFEREVVQIRPVSAGELADLLKLVEAGMTEPEVIQTHRQT
tara:strand:- start:301 stop:492 length:192 start_codon:yes stop_codon:yes gene_type:complete